VCLGRNVCGLPVGGAGVTSEHSEMKVAESEGKSDERSSLSSSRASVSADACDAASLA